MTQLLLTLTREPEPRILADPETLPLLTPYARRLCTQVREHYGSHGRDGEGDREDYWEMAARLDAVLRSDADVWLWDQQRTPFALCGEPGEWPGMDWALEEISAGRLLHYGPIVTHDYLMRFRDDRADRYARSGVFASHCGRRIEFGGTDLDDGVDPERHVAAVMTRWHAAGIRDVVVKAVAVKQGWWRMPTHPTLAENRREVYDALDWTAVRLGGRGDAFLVQERIPMSHEWRAFVVDDMVVTGAGCIVQHTPLIGERYAPWLEPVRGDGAMVKDRARVRRLLRKAQTFAAEAGEEMPRAYVVDVALSDEEPVVIECNGLSNSGLYASEPRLVVDALVQGAARR